MATAESRLAIDGGRPVRSEPIPQGPHGVSEIGDEEIAAVTEVLRSRKIFRYLKSEEESYASRLEAAYREMLGVRYALATTGGTSALIAALVGLGVGTGDEVIIPGYTYIATAAAVITVGAIPVIAEIDDTLTLDPRDVERLITPLTKAIIPVHMRGLPAQMDEIMAIARAHGLKVLEDVAQANGGMYKGRMLGSIGDAGAFSFQHYKVITSGEGGMVVTNDETVMRRAACKHDSAMIFWDAQGRYGRSFAGENMRMCEMRAALGYVQFGRLAGILEKTRRYKRRVTEQIAGLPGVELVRSADPEGDCGISLGLFLPSAEEAQRFSRALRAEGVPNGTAYSDAIPDRHIYRNWEYVMNKWSMDSTGYPWDSRYYKGKVEYSPDMCPKTLDYLGRNVVVGINQRWTDEVADDVARAIRKVALAFYG